MANPSNAQQQEKHWPAILGWGSLAVFSIAFVWLISGQLGENWSKRERDAEQLVRSYRPAGYEHNLEDLTKLYSINAKEKDAYVGEFQWKGVQKDGPLYEVQLLWKEEQNTRQAVWRANLETDEVRPQGEWASTLPKRAQEGTIEN